MKVLKTILYFVFICVWTLMIFPLAVLAMPLALNTDASVWWAREVWSPIILWVGRIKLEVIGREHVDPRRPTIYVANHASAIDIPALYMAIPVPFKYVAKKQLQWVPLIGWYLWLAKYPLVDRGNRASAIATLEKAAERIRRGTSIVVYPEGTRSEDGSILPFKKGPFALALKAGVPICPVTIVGANQVLPNRSFVARKGTIRVKIGAPLDTSTYAEHERERLAHDVRAVVIRQSLELGGPGGDVEDAVALPGLEGLGKPKKVASR